MSEHTLFLLIGFPIVAIGVVLLYALLRHETALRKQGRCPKCWYDMTGAPTLTCPECGHEVRRQKRLHTLRWRRTRVLAAGLLVVLGIVAMRWPYLRDYHWFNHVPNGMLISIWDNFEWDWSSRELGRRFKVDLGGGKQSVASLILPDADDKAAFAERAIAKMLDEETEPMLRASLLGWLQTNDRLPESLAPALVAMVKSQNRPLKQQAMWLLSDDQFAGLLGNDEVVDALLKEHQLAPGYLVGRLLSESSHEAALEYFMNGLDSPFATTRLEAIRSAPLTDAIIERLIETLDDENARCRYAAGLRLGRADVATDRVVPILVRHLYEGDAQFASRLLADVYPEHAAEHVERFVSLLQSPDVNTRIAAAQVSGRLAGKPGTADALPALTQMISASSGHERGVAISAILNFDRQRVLPFADEILEKLEALPDDASRVHRHRFRQFIERSDSSDG